MPPRKLLILIAAALLAVTAGCAARESARMDNIAGQSTAAGAPAAEMSKAQAGGATGSPAASDAEPLPSAPLPRKIIYTSEVELVAPDAAAAENRLKKLVADHRGYVAESDVSGAPGSPRQGRWKVRVPVEHFDAFMAAVVKLGELQRVHTDSEDVSEEYYDLQARLANKRVEEKRLLRHLQVSTGRLQEILAVEKELTRVREEIERIQGRVRVLSNLSELTTVTVTIHGVRNYIPPRAPTFGEQIARTFGESLGVLRAFAKGVLLVAVALIPWLIVLGLLGTLIWVGVRRWHLGRDLDDR